MRLRRRVSEALCTTNVHTHHHPRPVAGGLLLSNNRRFSAPTWILDRRPCAVRVPVAEAAEAAEAAGLGCCCFWSCFCRRYSSSMARRDCAAVVGAAGAGAGAAAAQGWGVCFVYSIRSQSADPGCRDRAGIGPQRSRTIDSIIQSRTLPTHPPAGAPPPLPPPTPLLLLMASALGFDACVV